MGSTIGLREEVPGERKSEVRGGGDDDGNMPAIMY
jgi:hypothetical protein